MRKNTRPEFGWDPVRELYTKKIKDEATGKWIAVYGHTKEELRRKIKDREAALAKKLDAKNNPEVWEYAAQWYNLHKGDYRPKRQDDYRNAINNHIAPAIGAKKVKDVTYSDVKSVLAAVDGKSKSLQQKIVTAMRKIFDAAVRDRIIEESPCKDLKPGGKETQEKIALTKKQQQELLNATRDLRIYPFVMLCLYTGLRREEALGLKWADVDLESEAPHVNVRGACNWNGKNEAEITPLLKSEAAWRTIPIPQQLVDFLKAEKETATGEMVICRKDGTPYTASAFRRAWAAITLREEHTFKGRIRGKDVQRDLKVGDVVPFHPDVTVTMDFHTTPHLLRHTYISELILAGVSVKRVQYLAGHATPEETLRIYTHLMENRPEDLIEEVRRAFSPEVSSSSAQISAQYEVIA